jgi:hypothetical protein
VCRPTTFQRPRCRLSAAFTGALRRPQVPEDRLTGLRPPEASPEAPPPTAFRRQQCTPTFSGAQHHRLEATQPPQAL